MEVGVAMRSDSIKYEPIIFGLFLGLLAMTSWGFEYSGQMKVESGLEVYSVKRFSSGSQQVVLVVQSKSLNEDKAPFNAYVTIHEIQGDEYITASHPGQPEYLCYQSKASGQKEQIDASYIEFSNRFAAYINTKIDEQAESEFSSIELINPLEACGLIEPQTYPEVAEKIKAFNRQYLDDYGQLYVQKVLDRSDQYEILYIAHKLLGIGRHQPLTSHLSLEFAFKHLRQTCHEYEMAKVELDALKLSAEQFWRKLTGVGFSRDLSVGVAQEGVFKGVVMAGGTDFNRKVKYIFTSNRYVRSISSCDLEAGSSWNQLCEKGVVDHKSLKRWRFFNHPDRFSTIWGKDMARELYQNEAQLIDKAKEFARMNNLSNIELIMNAAVYPLHQYRVWQL